jgi:uncharacterized membrane protein
MLLLIMAAAFAVRFIQIDRWPLWGDEALTLLLAQWPVKILFLAPIDPTPGLYYALHKMLLGPMVDTAAARSIALVCGTLLVPATYFFAREARAPALVSAALVALSFPLIDYSQEARAYSLLVLLVICSAIFFIRWTRSQRQNQLMLALLLGVLAFYTHLVSIFWLGPMFIGIIWKARRQSVQPLLLFILLAVPEVGRLIAYKPGNFSWLAQATLVEAGDTLSRALLPFRPVGIWAGLAALLIGWRVWAHRKQLEAWARENPGAAFALLALMGCPVALWVFGLVAKPIFMTRTMLMAVPAFMVAVALLLKQEHRLAGLGVVALYGASLLVTGTTRVKDDWREIAGRAGGDAILMCQPWQAAAMRHALSRDNRMLLLYDNGLTEVDGTPWQIAYFDTLSTKEKMAMARQKGASVSKSLYPVWPVRTGQIEQMTAAPGTLGQAIAYCVSVRPPDRQPRYIPD